ncbi:hypothetical protein [Paenibacillus xylanilyticus]|uniref:Uncharacterized protein n=1 Tax=Paenibacillus xylanilyticus TaxID=248903 RepID=A0A7Y6ETG9_9BACL|nr:hypothetical protein [Paenibacillus xylanilyticus]NUU73823.1 hypothetical protein [Paenibacillus xylanilyticus]
MRGFKHVYSCIECGWKMKSFKSNELDGQRCHRCAGAVIPTKVLEPGVALVQDKLPLLIHSVQNNYSSFHADDGRAEVKLNGCRVEATLILPNGDLTSQYHFELSDIVFSSGVPDIETTVRKFIKNMCILIDGSETDADQT